MNNTRQMFAGLFENRLRLLRNNSCTECDAKNKRPLLPWLVGSAFQQANERLVFIGKPHRANGDDQPGDVLSSGIVDPTETVDDDLWDRPWAYWSYTREIAVRLYGANAYDSIAMTTLVKCSNTLDSDKTTPTMIEKCVGDLQVVWREMEILHPYTAIFYTYGLHRGLLTDIPIALPGTIHEVTTPDHRVACGQKNLGWWERWCATSWTNKLRILVVGHPERMRRQEYVDRLLSWIRPTTDADR